MRRERSTGGLRRVSGVSARFPPSIGSRSGMPYLPTFRTVADRCEFDRLLASATNYERMPEFHAGRVRVDLERMRRYVERLQHPERSCPVVHITGTKGKGSTSALVARILSFAGFRTGLHTSPHLERLEERVQVDLEPISEAALLAATNRVLDAAHVAPVLEFPTFFELMTLVAFLEFERVGCRFAVHEVGLGGRLDATNVVLPAVTAITNVALEHTAILGSTIAEIAQEKSGIVKPGAPLVTAAEGEALAVANAAARIAGVAVRRVGHDLAIDDLRVRRDGIEVGIRTWRRRYPRLELALRGRHQATNLALALGILEVLAENDHLTIEVDAVREALRGFAVPCRMETISTQPSIVVDGAHTPESIAAAIDTLREEAPDRKIVALCGMARDKDVTRAAEVLARVAAVVATTYGNDRERDPEEIARSIQESGGQAVVEKDPGSGLARACHLAEREGVECVVLVVGSLYLASRVRALVLGKGAALYPERA